MSNTRKLLLFVALLVYCLLFQGVRGLYERDEGRYTTVANEMIVLNDYVHPHVNREYPHWTKPPLTYWAIAGSLNLFGHNEFAARLPGALAFFVTILLVYGIARVFIKERPWIAPLIYASALFPFAASNIVSTDNLLTLWMAATMFAHVRASWSEDKQMYTPWMLAMWAFLALAFLTKGPVGLLPLAVIGIYAWLTPARKRHGALPWILGIAVFLAIAVPWFALIVRDYPDLPGYFIKDETLARVAGKHHRNAQWYGAIVIYLPVLLLGTLPWTWWMVRDGYRSVRALLGRGRHAISSMQDQSRFLLLWFLCPLVVFVLIRSRLPLYILPVFAPLALWLARRLSSRAELWTSRHIQLVGTWMVALLVLRGGMALVPSKHDARVIAQAFASIPVEYDEIVFYEMPPQYGLSFYLGKDVEAVENNTMSDEFGETERRLWVVDFGREVDLEEFVRKNFGRQLAHVGRLQPGQAILQELQVTGTKE